MGRVTPKNPSTSWRLWKCDHFWRK